MPTVRMAAYDLYAVARGKGADVRRFVGLAFALILLAGAAFGQGADVLRRGIPGPPGSLDHHQATTTIEYEILGDLYEGLTTLDAEGAVVAGAASGWEAAEDGLSWRFDLRPDGRWSNGDPVVAEDFAAAFRRLLDPATAAPYAQTFAAIRGGDAVIAGLSPPDALGVTAEGDATLRIDLERPVPYLPELLSHFAAMPLHRPSLAAHGTGFARAGRLVTNGAYILAEYAPNRPIVLERNPAFRDAGAVRIARVVYEPVSDPQACARRFEAGEIDLCPAVPTGEIATLRARLGGQVRDVAQHATVALVFDRRRPPFDDARVRRALSLAVDRRDLAQRAMGGLHRPAWTWVPPGLHDEAVVAPTLDFKDADMAARRAEALRLMTEAGYGPGAPLTVSLDYPATGDIGRANAAIAAAWRPLGVTLRPRGRDLAAHYAHLQSGTPFEIGIDGWVSDFRDPITFLDLKRSDAGGLNIGGYADPVYDARLDAAATEADPRSRGALLAEAEARLLADGQLAPILHLDATRLVADRVRGWIDAPTGPTATRHLHLRP